MVIPFLLFSTLEWIESFLFGFRPLSRKTSYSDFRFLNFLTASGIIWIMLWFLFCRRNRTIILSANRTSFILFAVQLSSMSSNKQADMSLCMLLSLHMKQYSCFFIKSKIMNSHLTVIIEQVIFPKISVQHFLQIECINLKISSGISISFNYMGLCHASRIFLLIRCSVWAVLAFDYCWGVMLVEHRSFLGLWNQVQLSMFW